MAATLIREAKNRDKLSQAIMDVLQSWPAVHRHIFAQAHYAGMRPEEIASCTDLQPPEVNEILRLCETKLRVALKTFRDRPAPKKVPLRTPSRMMTLVRAG